MRSKSHNIYHVDYGVISTCSRVLFGSLTVAAFAFVTLNLLFVWSFLAVL